MSKSKYIKDDTLKRRGERDSLLTFDNLLKAGVVLYGVSSLHKSGALSSSILDMAKKVSSNGRNNPVARLNETRAYLSSNLKEVESSVLRKPTKDVLASLKKDVIDPNIGNTDVYEMIEKTQEDARMIKNILLGKSDKGLENMKSIYEKSNLENVDLLNKVFESRDAVIRMAEKSDEASQKAISSVNSDSILKSLAKSKDELSESMMSNGFRPATITDFFNVDFGDGGKLKLSTKGNLSQFDDARYKSKSPFVEEMEGFLNTFTHDLEGNNRVVKNRKQRVHHGVDLSTLTIDENLKVDASGDILDFRAFDQSLVGTIRGLSNDVKIPVLGLNPLKMLGANKYKKPKTSFAFISEDMVAPALTLQRGNSASQTIKKLKDKTPHLHGVKNGVMIADGDVYKHSTTRKGLEKINYGVKKNITLSYSNGIGGFSDINQLEYSQLKMQGISTVKDRAIDGSKKKDSLLSFVADKLDVGNQDKLPEEIIPEMGMISDVDRAFSFGLSKMLHKTGSQANRYKNAKEMIYKGEGPLRGPIPIVTNSITKTDGASDVLDMIAHYGSSIGADFTKSPESVNSISAVGHFLVDRLSTTLGSVGLGLSETNNTGLFARSQDIIMKRMAPIIGAYVGWQGLNSIIETEDADGHRVNLNRSIMEMYANLDVGLSSIKDAVGITSIAKGINELMPGMDFIGELPLNPFRNIDQSAEERKEYWAHGKDAVRKGRFWGLSTNSAFTGGTVDYFRANKLQQAKSDALFSDSKFGSRREYMSQILNPYHYDAKHFKDRPYMVTAPAFENIPVFGDMLSSSIGKIVKPQLKMHNEYWDGNKPLTSKEIKEFGINEQIKAKRHVSDEVSNVLREEAGLVVKEVYKREGNLFDIMLNAIGPGGNVIHKANEFVRKFDKRLVHKMKTNEQNYKSGWLGSNPVERSMNLEVEPYTGNLNRMHLLEDIEKNYTTYLDAMYAEKGPIREWFESNRRFGDKVHKFTMSSLPMKSFQDTYYSSNLSFKEYKPYTNLNDRDRADLGEVYRKTGVALGRSKDFKRMNSFDLGHNLAGEHIVYRTSGGKISVENAGREQDPFMAINSRKESVDSFMSYKAGVVDPITGNYDINGDTVKAVKEMKVMRPNGVEHSVRKGITNFSNVAGIYGYGASLVTGDYMQGTSVIETSGHAMSFNKIFWDEDMGGFTGDVSEIFRRLVQNRRNYGVHYHNPIKNTMPDWMPGEGSFVDFQHGDPFSKIKNGEERLVGHAYERMYGIDVDDYKISSSKLGGDVNSIVNYFLKRDGITDDHSLGIVKKGTAMHERVEQYMLKNHVAIDTEKEVWDHDNNISGIYDARIYDETSRTGQAIVDVKTINDKGFKEVVRTQKGKEEHVKQVNFGIHNTNKNNKGGILYINRDDPTQMNMVKFDYSRQLYNETINNVNEARRQVQDAIASGQISRGERYKPIDKYRILADTSPYSDEYNDMKKYMSSLSLSKTDKEEFDRINERVTEQRKKLRTHDYKFKYSNVETRNVRIGSDMGRYTYSIRGGDESIKFAGINIKTATDFKNEGFSDKESKEKVAKIKSYINKSMVAGVRVKVAEDPHLRYNKDTAKTMDAVVYSGTINLNKALVRKGYATEDKEDFSAPALYARFNGIQRMVGKTWENVAHQNTVFNNKILRVRSAAEEYERSHIYNVDFKQWTQPIDHFVKPLIWRAGRKEELSSKIVASAGVGILGAMVGRNLKAQDISKGIGALEKAIPLAKKLDLASRSSSGAILGAMAGAASGGVLGFDFILGSAIGSAFGGPGSKGRLGKLVGAAVGVGVVASAKAYRIGYEAQRGQKWKPKEKVMEEATVDYLDKLEYIRNRRLFEIYATKSEKEDKINVRKVLTDSNKKAASQKAFSRRMENLKNHQRRHGYFDIRQFKRAGLKVDKSLLKGPKHFMEKIEKDFENPQSGVKNAKDRFKRFFENATAREKKGYVHGRFKKRDLDFVLHGDDAFKKAEDTRRGKAKRYHKRVKEERENALEKKRRLQTQVVNNAINGRPNEAFATSTNAMKAIDYYNKSEATMYAYDPGDSITDFTSALPERDKKFFNDFLKAGGKERKKIMDMAPSYMRRALQSAYGLDVDEKVSLDKYFDKHALPDADWEGWREDMDFDAIKTKVISRAGYSLASHGIWEDDIIKANAYGAVDLPDIDHRTNNIVQVRKDLQSVLGKEGYRNIAVDVSRTRGASRMNFDFVSPKAVARKMQAQSVMREDYY